MAETRRGGGLRGRLGGGWTGEDMRDEGERERGPDGECIFMNAPNLGRRAHVSRI